MTLLRPGLHFKYEILIISKQNTFSTRHYHFLRKLQKLDWFLCCSFGIEELVKYENIIFPFLRKPIRLMLISVSFPLISIRRKEKKKWNWKQNNRSLETFCWNSITFSWFPSGIPNAMECNDNTLPTEYYHHTIQKFNIVPSGR